MRNIQVGDEVVMIELWPKNPNDDMKDGEPLFPEQTTQDCRLYGYCVAIGEDGTIFANSHSGDDDGALQFPTSILPTAKRGDSVAYHVEDACELFPIIEKTE